MRGIEGLEINGQQSGNMTVPLGSNIYILDLIPILWSWQRWIGISSEVARVKR